jgi:CheY-like chemotaxis protein
MFRLLIVEDEPRTRGQLETFLHETIPDCRIDSARSVREAWKLLSAAERAGTPYDVAILDFRLPEALGEPTEVNESVCQMIHQVSPNTFVIHITAYPDDPIVTQHIRKMHIGQGRTRTALVSKLETLWPTLLMKQVKSHLFSSLVRDKFDRLFPKVSMPVGADRDPGQATHAALNSMTHEVRDLIDHIQAYWGDLDKSLQKDLCDFFSIVVPEDGGRPRVSLI